MTTINKRLKSLFSGDPLEDSKEELKPLEIKENRLFWGFRNIPFELATRHFLVMGSTGSGKTTIIRLLLKSVVPNIGKGICKRAFVYDNKREYISFIKAMEPRARVKIVNPFDARTYAWDMSADVTHARHAQSIAKILIPEEKNSHQPFFSDAARAMLTAVMAAFAAMHEIDGLSWSLRDVIVALRSKRRILTVVKNFPAIEEMIAPYLNDREVFPSILSTIATKLAPFEVVAALWEKARKKKRTFSLASWLKSQSILVLSSSPANRASITPIVQVLFTRLSDLLLDAPNTDDSLTWMFLDEVREAGKLEGLSSLLNQGRSKGVAVVLGFQEIEGLIDVYGQNVANEICGQCGYKTFLRTGSPQTANWVQFYWGNRLYFETAYSHQKSYSEQGISTSEGVSYNPQIKPVMQASTLQSFPPTGPRSGVLAAMHDIPNRDYIERVEKWSEIANLFKNDDELLRRKLKKYANEIKWPRGPLHDELVLPWVDDGLERVKNIGKRLEELKRKGAAPPKSGDDTPSSDPAAGSGDAGATGDVGGATGSKSAKTDQKPGSTAPKVKRKH